MTERPSRVANRIVAVGAISAGLGVAIGAFGAHALEQRVAADMLANYETGVRYHLYHSLGILAVGLFVMARGAARTSDAAGTRLRWSALLMLSGIVLFSGSLYTMALTGLRWLGAVTPVGGVALLVAWILFAWAAMET